MEPNPSSDKTGTPPQRPRRSGRERHPHGRAWVLALWIVLRLGEVPLAWLAWRTVDPEPDHRLSLIISALWTTALFAALWMKQVWARPVTATFVGLFAFWWGYGVATLGMYLARSHVWINPERLAIPSATMLVNIAVMIVLLRSKNIRYLTDPTAGWRTREC